MHSVSVIIPSYNSAVTISHTLKSLLGSPSPLLKEVIIADSSDDGQTPTLLDTVRSEKLRVMCLPTKTAPAAARNLGAQQAHGDILAFIDSDAYAAEDWLENIAKVYADGHRVGGGSVSVPPFQKNKILALAQFFLQFNEHMDVGGRDIKKYVPSCNLFCDKELFEKLGGFPEIRASEDVLFGLKAAKICPVIFDPGIRVYHIFRENLEAYLRNQRMLGKYILVYRRAYYRRLIYKGWLAPVLSPAFVCFKLMKLTAKILATGKAGLIGPFLMSLPWVLLGLVYWWGGFFGACFEKRADELTVIETYA